MQSNDLKAHKLRIRYYGSTHRGVHTAVPIKKGEDILSVPLNICISDFECSETPVGR